MDRVRVGTIPPFVLPHLFKYPEVFDVVKNDDGSINHVAIAPQLETFEDRSQRIANVLHEFRKDDLFVALRGWRNEVPYFLMQNLLE